MVGQICCQYSNLYILATNFCASLQGGHLKFFTGQLVNRELLDILVGYPSGNVCYLWLTQQLNSVFCTGCTQMYVKMQLN
jgi:hypothetical protein